MSSAAEILVVILLIALAVFIVLGIICFILIIRVTRQIGDITKNMQNISSGIDNIVQNFVQISSPIIIMKTVLDLFKKFNKKGEKNE